MKNFTLYDMRASDFRLFKAILKRRGRGEITDFEKEEGKPRYDVVNFSIQDDPHVIESVNEDILNQYKFSDEFQFINIGDGVEDEMEYNEGSVDSEDEDALSWHIKDNLHLDDSDSLGLDAEEEVANNARILRNKRIISYEESSQDVYENIESNVSIAIKRLDHGKMPAGLNPPRDKKVAIKDCDSIKLYQDGLTEYSYIHYDDNVYHQAVGPVRDPRADRKVIEDKWGEKSANKYMNTHHPEFTTRRKKVIGTHKRNAEWLHSIANSLGGPLVSWNMASGSHAANTQMAVVENAIARQPGISVMVTTYKKKNTQVGMWYTYDVIAQNNLGKITDRIRFEIDAQRDWYNKEDYDNDNQRINDFLKSTEKDRYAKPQALFNHKVPLIFDIKYNDNTKNDDNDLIGKRPSFQRSSYVKTPRDKARETRFDLTSTQVSGSPVMEDFANETAMDDYRLIRNIMKINNNIGKNSNEAIKIIKQIDDKNKKYLSYPVCIGYSLLMVAIKKSDFKVFAALLPKVNIDFFSYSGKTAINYINEIADTNKKEFFLTILKNNSDETQIYDKSNYMSASISPAPEYQNDKITQKQQEFSKLSADKQFYLFPRNSQQQGWNCGDVALSKSRREILQLLLDNQEDVTLRSLLAPEIKNAAYNSYAKLDNGLPAEMNGLNQVNLENAIHDYEQASFVADPIIKEIYHYLSDVIDGPENYESLKDFFDNAENRDIYRELSAKFDDLVKIYEPYETLSQLCSSIEIYNDYVETFFDPDNENWLAFQPEAGGTNIFDAIAYLDETQIKIWQQDENNKLVVIHQTAQYGSANSVLNILYQGNNHFIALRPNPTYRENINISHETKTKVVAKPFSTTQKNQTEKSSKLQQKPAEKVNSCPSTGFKKIQIGNTVFTIPDKDTQSVQTKAKPKSKRKPKTKPINPNMRLEVVSADSFNKVAKRTEGSTPRSARESLPRDTIFNNGETYQIKQSSSSLKRSRSEQSESITKPSKNDKSNGRFTRR